MLIPDNKRAPEEMPIVNQVQELERQRNSLPRSGMDMGRRLRTLRKSKRLTLREAAQLTGVSTSALSKIERNDLSPTLTTMQRVASGLGVELSALLGDQAPVPQVTGRRSIARAGNGENLSTQTCVNKLLCSDLKNKRFTPIRTTVQARSPDEYDSWGVSHGDIFLTVLKGDLVVHSRLYEPLVLHEGDSLYYDATTEHCWTSLGDTDAELVWILSN